MPADRRVLFSYCPSRCRRHVPVLGPRLLAPDLVRIDNGLERELCLLPQRQPLAVALANDHAFALAICAEDTIEQDQRVAEVAAGGVVVGRVMQAMMPDGREEE